MWKLILTGILLLVVGVVQATVQPLGVRNNNPGNIIKTDITWQGEVECASRFECFSTPEMGLRAMAKNLLSYQSRHKLKTIGEIIHRWSPPHENQTHALSRATCKRLQVSCDTPINLAESNYLKGLIKSLVVQENGYNPYSDDTIEEVLNGIANTNGNYYDGRRGHTRRGDEAVGNEAAVSAPAARNDDEDAGADERLPRKDFETGERALSVDSSSDSSNRRICRATLAEAGGHMETGSGSYGRLDRVESRLPVLRRFGGNSLEDSTGPSPDAPRYTRSQPYTRPVFWRLNSWA